MMFGFVAPIADWPKTRSRLRRNGAKLFMKWVTETGNAPHPAFCAYNFAVRRCPGTASAKRLGFDPLDHGLRARTISRELGTFCHRSTDLW